MTTIERKHERRFWGRVALPDEAGCMLWTGAVTSHGYGHMRVGDAMLGAHKISWALANASAIPTGRDYHVDHLCRNKRCVAPNHLELVPAAVNSLRGTNPCYHAWAADTCTKGHPLEEEPNSEGRRRCRTCKLEYNRRARQRRAAA